MGFNSEPVESGVLGELDLIELGAASGLLWRSSETTLVGLGARDTVELRVAEGADQLALELAGRRGVDAVNCSGSGPVAFAALPFAREGAGVAQVPEMVIGQTGNTRFVTTFDGVGVANVVSAAQELLAQPAPEMPASIEIRPGMSATEWRDHVVTPARDHLVETSMRKAVFARQLVLEASAPFPVRRILRDLARRFPTANLFSIDGFLGASPELLVSRSDRDVRAHPLAGTARRHEDPAQDAALAEELRGSTKDRTEHRITIDWLLTELLPFCSYVDAEPEPTVVSLANVHHLGTLVEGVLSAPPASVLDLVAAVHPTPAVGGDPQDEALGLIKQLEGFDRKRYAGPAGWVDADGSGEFAVSVRTAQVDGVTATICAGVGVVAQSDPEAELEETQAKFRAMLGSFLAPESS